MCVLVYMYIQCVHVGTIVRDPRANIRIACAWVVGCWMWRGLSAVADIPVLRMRCNHCVIIIIIN